MKLHFNYRKNYLDKWESGQTRKISHTLTQKIVSLYEQRYWDFNVLHFKDKLEEIHNIRLSYETIRKILISGKLHTAKKRKKVYRRRRRMPKAGMLIQMDSLLA